MALLNEAERAALTERLAAYRAADLAGQVRYRETVKAAADMSTERHIEISNQAWRVWQRSMEKEWAGLARDTGPIVAWIIGLRCYTLERTDVLEKLAEGASLPDLLSLAEYMGWCEVWTDYLDRALAEIPALQGVSS